MKRLFPTYYKKYIFKFGLTLDHICNYWSIDMCITNNLIKDVNKFSDIIRNKHLILMINTSKDLAIKFTKRYNLSIQKYILFIYFCIREMYPQLYS